MNIEKMREEFLQWLLEVHGLESEWQPERNCFKDYAAHLAFQAWQASRAAIEVELPPLSGMNGSLITDGIQKTREHNRYNAAIKDCRKAIESRGLKVKSC